MEVKEVIQRLSDIACDLHEMMDIGQAHYSVKKDTEAIEKAVELLEKKKVLNKDGNPCDSCLDYDNAQYDQCGIDYCDKCKECIAKDKGV